MNKEVKKTLSEIIEDLKKIIAYLDLKKSSQGLNSYEIKMQESSKDRLNMLKKIELLKQTISYLTSKKELNGLTEDEEETFKNAKDELKMLEVKSGIKEEKPPILQLVS